MFSWWSILISIKNDESPQFRMGFKEALIKMYRCSAYTGAVALMMSLVFCVNIACLWRAEPFPQL
ncbi:hypothetical protein CF70_002660 [Cupriavidus sp. SK-3]|nr:hypothetical protein CF70_002660 [Cupriavidus sp. SK-3]